MRWKGLDILAGVTLSLVHAMSGRRSAPTRRRETPKLDTTDALKDQPMSKRAKRRARGRDRHA